MVRGGERKMGKRISARSLVPLSPDQNRYLGVGEETTVGTPVAAAVYLPIQSERIVPDHRILVVEDVVKRSYARSKLGPFRNAGDIVMHVIPGGFTKILKWTLGSVSTVSGAVYTHTFQDADTIKSFTARIGAEKLERVIAGCFVNTLEIACARELVMATIGIIGGQETKGSIATPSFVSEDEVFAFHECSALIAGSDETSEIESLTVRINNNIPDRWTFGSRYEKRAEVGPLVVEGTADFSFQDADQYDRFLAGSEFALTFKAEGSLIGDTSEKYLFQIELPKCKYLSDTVPHIDRREPLKVSAPFRAFYSSSNGYTIKITVKNQESSI